MRSLLIDETIELSPDTPPANKTSTPDIRPFGKCSLSRLGEIDEELRRARDRGVKRTLSAMELEDDDIDAVDEEGHNVT